MGGAEAAAAADAAVLRESRTGPGPGRDRPRPGRSVPLPPGAARVGGIGTQVCRRRRGGHGGRGWWAASLGDELAQTTDGRKERLQKGVDRIVRRAGRTRRMGRRCLMGGQQNARSCLSAWGPGWPAEKQHDADPSRAGSCLFGCSSTNIFECRENGISICEFAYVLVRVRDFVLACELSCVRELRVREQRIGCATQPLMNQSY